MHDARGPVGRYGIDSGIFDPDFIDIDLQLTNE